jgi:hypothetical protein
MANKSESFMDSKLPSDLVDFLRANGKLDYDPSLCEAGTVTLLPLEDIRVALYPLDADNNDIPGNDPHKGEGGQSDCCVQRRLRTGRIATLASDGTTLCYLG